MHDAEAWKNTWRKVRESEMEVLGFCKTFLKPEFRNCFHSRLGLLNKAKKNTFHSKVHN